MSQPAAKKGDRIAATDTHLILPASGGPPVAMALPFSGEIDGELSSDVLFEDAPAALVGSTATNAEGHRAVGGSFANRPSDRATIERGSATVWANGKPVARAGDPALTCNDPVDLPVGEVLATGSVLAGR